VEAPREELYEATGGHRLHFSTLAQGHEIEYEVPLRQIFGIQAPTRTEQLRQSMRQSLEELSRHAEEHILKTEIPDDDPNQTPDVQQLLAFCRRQKAALIARRAQAATPSG
jgi:hypothetical protein